MRYRSDPVAFAQEKLGLRIWDRQAEILLECAKRLRVAVRSGHKIGKSTAAAVLALWFVYCFKGARVVMTSSTDRQVRRILWREVRRLYASLRGEFGVDIALAPDTGLQLPDGREIVGFSTKEPERIAGFSGENLLFIVDEASGVPEPIFEAIEGNRAGGARLVLFSNPTNTSGYFFEAFTTKCEFWSPERNGRLIHVSSEEAAAVKIPGLATQAWIDEKVDEWGVESPLFQVRVKGNFPTQADNAVIGLQLVEAAHARWEADAEEPDAPLELGVDVARYGDDDSVITARRGLYVWPPVVIHGQDTIQIAGKVLEIARARRRPREKVRVKVDGIGVGAGVVDQLKQHRTEVDVLDINVAERATDDTYARLRDQIWFAIRDWLKEGGAMPEDARLDAELVAPTYSFDPQGRIKVESKDETKKRLKRSPDRADSLGLAIYSPRRSVQAGGGFVPRPNLEDRSFGV
jgi:phage terminase large subunit